MSDLMIKTIAERCKDEADRFDRNEGSRHLGLVLREAAAEISRLRLGLEIIASDPWPCTSAIQSTAQRYLDGGNP